MEVCNIPSRGSQLQKGDEKEVIKEEEKEVIKAAKTTPGDVTRSQTATSQSATSEQIAFAKMWQFHYLGIHCTVDNALDYDDCI